MKRPPILGSCASDDRVWDYLVANGATERLASKPPPGVRRGPAKECFGNASCLVLRDARFDYGEGVALIGRLDLAFLHAWVFERTTGKIVEVTWKEWGGVRYFGVRYEREAYIRHVARQHFHGVLGGELLQAERALTRGHPWSTLHKQSSSARSMEGRRPRATHDTIHPAGPLLGHPGTPGGHPGRTPGPGPNPLTSSLKRPAADRTVMSSWS